MNSNHKSWVIFFFAAVYLFPYSIKAQKEYLQTKNGYIVGYKEGESFVFKGIPYAQPPIGQSRFKPPLPVQSWSDTIDCTNFRSESAQMGYGKHPLRGSENSLFLNVYSPSKNAKANLPVLVWIHGGAMLGGSGNGENGHAFSDNDSIVTITINYRLGVFGFLYLGDIGKAYQSSGNNGLLDCIMALKWVKENIKSFGGDPSKVTVMGESAGAKLTSALAVTPDAKGLYSGLIMESGSIQCIRDRQTALAIRQKIMNQLHITNPTDILHFSTQKLIAAQNRVCKGAQATNYFGPVIDGHTITMWPRDYVAENKNMRAHFLIGTNKVESILFMNMDKRLYHPDSAVLKGWFGTNFSYVLSTYKKMATEVGPDSAAIATLTQYMYQMYSYRFANQLSQANDKVWMYRFDYSKNASGASHGAEMPFVWFLPKLHHYTSEEISLAKQVHQAWVNFIKKGNPISIGNAPWPIYKKGTIMVINKVSKKQKLEHIFDDKRYPSSCFTLR
ncbi:carboxylesterase/lipase family protein [Arachidicoccus sp.]|uniref:carboxylesterase/lipase family protein n=1 Tax=Arachidicoccus sp. TaxID=1872624 RepID=UPI003D1B5B52